MRSWSELSLSTYPRSKAHRVQALASRALQKGPSMALLTRIGSSRGQPHTRTRATPDSQEDNCEFLHRFNMLLTPECTYSAKYGKCNNKDCLFRHVDPESKKRTCPNYLRGFCRAGPCLCPWTGVWMSTCHRGRTGGSTALVRLYSFCVTYVLVPNLKISIVFVRRS